MSNKFIWTQQKWISNIYVNSFKPSSEYMISPLSNSPLLIQVTIHPSLLVTLDNPKSGPNMMIVSFICLYEFSIKIKL